MSRPSRRAAARVLTALALVAVLLAGPAAAQDQAPEAPTDAPADTTATSLAETPLAGTGSFVEDGTRITRGIVTAEVDGIALTADVYQPEDAGTNRPVVVLIHGGAWFQGAPSDMDQQGKLLANQGWVGVSISYRLAGPGNATWPQALADVQRQIRWVGANAESFGADPSKIALLGASAGAHLASLVASFGTTDIAVLTGAASEDPNPAVPVKAVVSWSAPIDLVDLAGTDGRPPAGCGSNEACQIFWELPFTENFLGCLPEACPDTYAQASPATWVKPETAPMWVANSTDELVPIGQLQEFTAALALADVDHTVTILDGQAHGQDYTDEVWNEMTPWLADHLGVPRPNPITFPARGSGLSTEIVLAIVVLLALLAIVGGAGWFLGRSQWSGEDGGDDGGPDDTAPVPDGDLVGAGATAGSP